MKMMFLIIILKHSQKQQKEKSKRKCKRRFIEIYEKQLMMDMILISMKWVKAQQS